MTFINSQELEIIHKIENFTSPLSMEGVFAGNVLKFLLCDSLCLHLVCMKLRGCLAWEVSGEFSFLGFC